MRCTMVQAPPFHATPANIEELKSEVAAILKEHGIPGIGIALVTKDQVENYARRKEMPISDIERWLSPNLAYEVE